MYSRYGEYKPFIPDNNRLKKERGDRREAHSEERSGGRTERAERFEGKKEKKADGGLLGGLLGKFNLSLDSDDILLILILLFLSKDSEDDELLIIIGLMLFMGGP